MFLVKLMICFYIIIILASIISNISKIKFNSLEGMESLDPLTQAKLNSADIISPASVAGQGDSGEQKSACTR